MSSGGRVAVIALVLAGAAGGFLWWQHQKQQPPPAAAPAPVAKPAAPVVTPAPPPAAEPAIRHPLDTAARAGGTLPALDQSDGYIKNALIDLFGRKPVASFLGLDGFARKFVATVDELGRDSAPAAMWPVNRTPGRFEVDAGPGGAETLGARNAARYAPFVHFATSVDTRRAVGLYTRLYPLFQQAYEDLGYPGKYFNDRVVEVIDNLLATPDMTGPIPVKRAEVEGAPAQAATPPPPPAGASRGGGGGLYLFADPALETRSAGQKILLRVGHENAVQLKAKLLEVRQQIAKGPGAR